MKHKKVTTAQKTKYHWYKMGQKRCPCCGVQLTWEHRASSKRSASVEHLVLKSHGGSNHQFNLLVLCVNCNADRGNSDWFEWIEKKQPAKKEWLEQKFISAVEKYYDGSSQTNDIAKRLSPKDQTSVINFLKKR